MGRNTYSVYCRTPGCKEHAVFNYRTRGDAMDGLKNRQEWKCIRHGSPDKTLSVETPHKTWTSEPVREETYGRFAGHDGFLFGPGFHFHAEDFPVGTVLRVVAEVILPGSGPVDTGQTGANAGNDGNSREDAEPNASS